MASAKIGALHVELGIDTAKFTAGINKVQGDLGKFSKLAAGAAAAVASLGAAAAVALGVAVKQAADYADSLDDAAQKIGVSVEALSRLGYAAKVEGIALDGLTTSMARLSKGMVEVATGGTGPTATAFNALGISVKTAAGDLRTVDEVFLDVADRFGRLEDGATKTAVAMAIFGKSGADLIPLLNHGRDGLAGFAAEADRLGQTITSDTAAAAAEFNDNLTRLDAVLGGLANRVVEAVIPSLRDLTKTAADPNVQAGIIGLANLVVGLGNAMATAVGFGERLVNLVPQIAPNEDRQVYAIPGQAEFMARHQTSGPGSSFKDKFGLKLGGSATDAASGDSGLKPFTIDLADLATTTKTAKEAIDPLQARIAELSDALAITHDPFTQMQMDLTDLKTIWQEGRIGVEQYGVAVTRVQLNAASSVLGMAGQISGALAGMFKDNKAFALANAVINTAEGATKALAQGGIWGFASAAAVVASGAAQIMSIMSAEPGSASVAPVSATVADVAPAAGPSTAVSVTVHGESVGRDAMSSLFDNLSEALADRGVQIALVPIGG